MDEFNQHDNSFEQFELARKKRDQEAEKRTGKPQWLIDSDREFKARELADEDRRKSVIFHALAKHDARVSGQLKTGSEVHPASGHALAALAHELESNPRVQRDIRDQVLNSTDPLDPHKIGLIHQSLQMSAVQRGTTTQQLVEDHTPSASIEGSLQAAYQGDRKRFEDHYQAEYDLVGKVNPYGDRPQPAHEMPFQNGTGYYPASQQQRDMNAQTDFWRYSEPLESGTVKQVNDRLEMHPKPPLSEDDQIRDLIIASELRYGKDQYVFHGSDEFKLKAQDILDREGDQLRLEALRHKQEAEARFHQRHPELTPKVQDQAARDIKVAAPLDIEPPAAIKAENDSLYRMANEANKRQEAKASPEPEPEAVKDKQTVKESPYEGGEAEPEPAKAKTKSRQKGMSM